MIILDFDQWSHDRQQALKNVGHAVHDEQGARLIAKHFAGFMTAPVAMLDGEVLEAKTRAVTDFTTIGADLVADEGSGQKFLYEFCYIPGVPRYYDLTMDANNVLVPLAAPVWSVGKWLIRYSVSSKNVA